MKKKHRWLYKHEAELLGLEPKENAKGRNQNRYYLSAKEWKRITYLRSTPNQREFIETQKKFNKDDVVISRTEKLQSKPIEIPEDFEIIKISTSETTGQQWIQYAPKQKELTTKGIDFEKIVKKFIKPIKVNKIKKGNLTKDFDSLTFTDVHIGLDTDKDNNTMYVNEWNEKELLKTSEIMVKETIKNQESDILYIDDLADLLDGFNGLTTRGGHLLPQNMTNEQCFDLAITFKVQLIQSLIPYYDKIIVNNICNDNHSGAFGYFVNSAMKQILETQYKNVKVNNHRKFLNHYIVGKIGFVITHGKDDKSLKFGFKVNLDHKGMEKIDQYCKYNNLYSKCDLIIVKKGDSHQALFDMCTSDDFYYYNYPALSPSSNWIKNNFKLGRRGFVNESFKDLNNYLKPFFISNKSKPTN